MKKISLSLLFILFTISLAYCTFARAQETRISNTAETVGQNMDLYRRALEKNNVLLAHTHLKKAIARLPEGPNKNALRYKLYDLNVKVLFSPAKTESAWWYEVKAGDTLGKIGRAHNTTIALLMKSNQLNNHIIRVGEKLKLHKETFTIHIDKSDNVLTLLSNNKIFKKYIVATGENNSTPIGTHTIESKLEDPTWFHAGAIVPPESPENILGTRWMGISFRGYGIHGTTLPESMGKQSTAGCVRMLNKDVEELYTIVPYGTEVEIVD